MDELVRQDAPQLSPQEYNNLLETYEHGEAVLHVQGDRQEADSLVSSDRAEGGAPEAGAAQAQAAAGSRSSSGRTAAEATRIEEERLMTQAAEAESRLREQEKRAADQEAQAARKESRSRRRQPSRWHCSYTVRRGETLPQIAARSEIYNDSSLWPLIYRANRDQIRDPKQLWPGQVLKIPRQFTRDEALEAKRYSGKK